MEDRMTSKLVVNTIEADTGISSVSFASSISMNSTAKFHFSAAGVDIGADTNINRPAAGVLGFNISGAEKLRIDTNGHLNTSGIATASNFKTGSSNLHSTGLTVGNNFLHTTGINVGTGATIHVPSSNVLTLGTNSSERLRIDSGGSVSIGDAATHTYSAHAEGDDLVIGGAGWRGMTIYGEGGGGVIQFADNADNRVGQILYNHSDNSMMFRTGGNQDRMKIASDIIETGSKTITGGNNLAIQGFAVKGIWSGSGSIGKSIELISGYDSAVKMAAIGYNLTDVNTGSTYGGDLTFHTQPVYGSPTTPLPERMRISSTGYVTKSVVPCWNLRPRYNSTQTTANTSSHHAIGWGANGTANSNFLQNCTLEASGFTYNIHNGQNYGKLKVPVAGRYYVNVTYRVENNPGQADARAGAKAFGGKGVAATTYIYFGKKFRVDVDFVGMIAKNLFTRISFRNITQLS